jgi:hypothetical protein
MELIHLHISRIISKYTSSSDFVNNLIFPTTYIIQILFLSIYIFSTISFVQHNLYFYECFVTFGLSVLEKKAKLLHHFQNL